MNQHMQPKRVNKTKEEIIAETKHKAKIAHNVEVAKQIFPLIADQKTIYNAQTVLNATAGFIKAEIQKNADLIKVSKLSAGITEVLASEKDSEIKTAIVKIMKLLKDESANDASSLLESYGRILGTYSAKKYMEKPMTDIKMADIIS